MMLLVLDSCQLQFAGVIQTTFAVSGPGGGITKAPVEARVLTKHFRVRGGGWDQRAQVQAVEQVDFILAPSVARGGVRQRHKLLGER